MKSAYRFQKTETLHAPSAFSSPLFSELYRNFTFTKGEYRLIPEEGCKLFLGNPTFTDLLPGDAYTVTVTQEGIGVLAKNENELIRAFSALLSEMLPDPAEETPCRIPEGITRGSFSVEKRFVHLCVFPEDGFFEIRRRIRLCGLMQFTHLVLEFWGTVPFRSFPAGNWREHSLSEAEVRLLVREGKELGLQMIPALNCLGHASGSRGLSGKQVVLDQAPEFADLFTPDGWCWDITNEKVFPLLQSMRNDLNDLFEHPAYFHLGCDEADMFEKGYLPTDRLADFLRDLTRDVENGGQIPMVWGDALLPSAFRPKPCDDARAERLLSALSEHTVVCNWDYHVTEIPIRSTLFFKDCKRPVIGCSFLELPNIRAHIETAVAANTGAVMATTWHRWSKTPLLETARLMGLPKTSWSRFCEPLKEEAVLLRKVLPGRNYEEYGYAKYQLGDRVD